MGAKTNEKSGSGKENNRCPEEIRGSGKENSITGEKTIGGGVEPKG
jgi:hypothetical protein